MDLTGLRLTTQDERFCQRGPAPGHTVPIESEMTVKASGQKPAARAWRYAKLLT